MKIVSIRDIKTNAFGNPIYVANLGGAVRSFGDECLKADGNPLSIHPEDYELYHLGEFNPDRDTTPEYSDDQVVTLRPAKPLFEILNSPVQIAAGSNYRKV